MIKKTFIFLLNKHNKIIIYKKNNTDALDCHYETSIVFTSYNHKFLLDIGHLASNIEILKLNLKKSLLNQLKLIDFTQSPGHDWNYTLNQPKKSIHPFGKNFNSLNKYLLYSYKNLCTWIYNDNKENIIFEITPLYPHTYTYKKRKRPYNYFLKWVQKYKPIYKQIISKELAQEWIHQADQILAEIDKNTEELHSQGKL